MALAAHTTGSGPALLLLHGWGLHSGVWAGFADQLGDVYRVTAVDLPGHGGSAPQGAFSLSDAADAVLEVAPAEAVWVGWSLGGMVALEAAARSPGRVRGLVLMASTPRFVAAEGWPGVDGAVLDRFAADLRADYRATLQRFLALIARGGAAESAALRALRRRFAAAAPPHPEALQAGLEILRNGDLRTRLTELEMPVLAIMGERDTLVPAAAAGVLASSLRQGRVETVRGAGHAPFLSHPGLCADLLRDALR